MIFKNNTVITFFLILSILNGFTQTNKNTPTIIIEVKDATTQSHLPYANIEYILNDTLQQDICNEHGKFTFKAPFPTTAKISFLGYESQTINISINQTVKHIAVKMKKANAELQEVVVTGTGTVHYLKNAPVQTEVISGKALRDFAGRDIEDVLSSLSSSITFSRSDMGNNIKINGLKNDYILILIDGKRMNGDIGGQNDLSRINLHNIQRIEIVKGAASSLYGSDAIAGVINFITKKNTDKLSITNNTRIGAHADITQTNGINFVHKNWNVSTQIDYKHTDGWRNTSLEWYRKRLYDNSVTRTVNPSKSYTLSQEIIFSPTKQLSWKGYFSFNKRWISRPTGIPQWRRHGFHYSNQSYAIRTNYQLNNHIQITWDNSFDKNNYYYDYTNRDYTELFKEDGTRIIYYPGDRILQTSQQRFISNIKGTLTTLPAHTVYTGMEFIHDKLVSPYRLKGDKAHTHSFAGFIQDEWNITPYLNITTGVRIDTHKEFKQTITPKVSAMYKIKNINLRLNYSNGFKAPTIKELYYQYQASIMSKLKAYYGNTELKPQLSSYYSINAEYRNDKIKISITSYHNRLRNMIALKTITTSPEDKLQFVEETMKYVNLAKAFSNGIDVSLEIQPLKTLKLNAGYSYLNAKAQQVEDNTSYSYLQYRPINATSHHNANWRISWAPTVYGYQWTVMLNGRYQSEKFYLTDGNTKAYQLWRLSSSRRITKSKKKWQIDLQTGIDNLFNYIDKTPFGLNRATTTPGRTLFFSLSCKFSPSTK